ncbi:MAG: extracellular solute-binding protein [Christensenellales bacterium]|jgi:ABC-type glycerol-3-phosphate transport system substrate-binding protein
MKRSRFLMLLVSLGLVCMMVLGQAAAEPQSKDVVTLKLFYSAPNEYENWKWGMDPVSKWVTEKTGIALDITFASTSDHQEFYTLLASDMISQYDLLFLGKYEPKLVEDGYVLSLTDLADKYCPEYYDVVSKEELSVHSINGKMYYTTTNYADSAKLANLPGARKAFSMFYNYQVIDKLGVDPASIKTLKDVEEIALRMRDELKIGYPIYLNSYGVTNTIDYVQILSASSFGAPGVVYPQADGTVTFNVKSEEYKAALKWLNAMYKKELIKPENFTFTNSINDEAVKNIAQKGDVGFVWGHMWHINQHRPEGNGGGIHGNGEMGLLQFAGQTPLAEGVSIEDIKVSDQNLSQIGGPAYYVLDRTNHPEECIQFITFLLSDECQRTNMYGLEGVSYTIAYNELFGMEMMTPTKEYAEAQTILTNEEVRIKYGSILPWQNSFRSSYGQNWASVPQIIVEEDGVKKQFGEMLIVIGNLYGSPFKTGNLTLNFTDPDELLLRNNVLEAWSNNVDLCVLAEDFDAAYEKMISDMNTVGLGQLEAKMTERYWGYYEMLKESRNEKWDLAVNK